MAIRESLLDALNSIATSDFVRSVTYAGASSKVTVSNLAKTIVENYTGSTLAGSSQSVKSAIDALDTSVDALDSAVDDVNESLSKSFIGSVTNVYWWQNSWTAPSDGMLVLRLTPNLNAMWYWYINDTSINATTGTWAHQFRGVDGNTVTHCIPVKKGATYSTALIDNLSTIYCFFYPMEIGGGIA